MSQATLVLCGSRSAGDVLRPLGTHVWKGLSGQTYPHTVFSLLGCPAPVAVSYVLVKRLEDGRPIALETGFTASDVQSLNLAAIRRRGAEIGANEVHLGVPSAPAEYQAAACDIAGAKSAVAVQD